MTKYRCYFTETNAFYVDIEADDETQATDKWWEWYEETGGNGKSVNTKWNGEGVDLDGAIEVKKC